MTVELASEERAPGYTLELTAETFAQMQEGLTAINTVTTAIHAMIPSHLAEMLDRGLAKSLGAIGMIEVVREEPVGTEERSALDLSETLQEVNERRGFPA
jgi:glucose-6-phosphate 1-dehydrogenase